MAGTGEAAVAVTVHNPNNTETHSGKDNVVKQFE